MWSSPFLLPLAEVRFRTLLQKNKGLPYCTAHKCLKLCFKPESIIQQERNKQKQANKPNKNMRTHESHNIQ